MQSTVTKEYSLTMMNVRDRLQLNARINTRLLSEFVAAVAPGSRLAPCPDTDPQKVALGILFNVTTRNECFADAVEDAIRKIGEFDVKRTGPQHLTVDMDPTYRQTPSANYTSVWDD
jgi:hypothetical protein